MDPDILQAIAQVVAVNIGAMLLLAVLSYVTSALMLKAVAALDRHHDPSTETADRSRERTV